VKTTDNCYVSETGFANPANRFILANCGAIGFLQVNYTGEYDVGEAAARIGKPSKAIPRSAEAAPDDIPLPEPLEETEIGSHFLINVTVGNDFAACRTCANVTCDLQQVYRFNQSVFAQCYEETTSSNPNETYWYETTDFCFAKVVDFWQSLDDGKFAFISAWNTGFYGGLDDEKCGLPGGHSLTLSICSI
jgi:hypothetical protein